jgi:phage gpG-like protein
MIDITLDTRAVDEALAHLRANINNMLPAMKAIGGSVKGKVKLCFTDTETPYGNRWKELSEVTKAKRRNRSMKPLNDTGVLKNSITYNASQFEVQIGTKEKYGITHQQGAAKGQYGHTRKGGPIPWGDIAARPFLPTQSGGLPPAWQTEILDIISRHLENGV